MHDAALHHKVSLYYFIYCLCIDICVSVCLSICQSFPSCEYPMIILIRLLSLAFHSILSHIHNSIRNVSMFPFELQSAVRYIGRNSTLQVTRRGGQLKNQQPSKSPSSASAQKRAFSSCCGTKECSEDAS